MGSEASRLENEASHELSTTATTNQFKESGVPTQDSRTLNLMSYIEPTIPLGTLSATRSATQENREGDNTPYELPLNHAPLPEIASSDQPQSFYELPSSDPTIIHPGALQPGKPVFRPSSASSLSPNPQARGLGFRPHSPSHLSMVSSLDGSLSFPHGFSPVSVTNDGTSAEV